MRPFADTAMCGDNGEVRHEAVVADPLIGRHDGDSCTHGLPHRRWPLGADGAIIFGHGGHHTPDAVRWGLVVSSSVADQTSRSPNPIS
jgi:hypothetical protein